MKNCRSEMKNAELIFAKNIKNKVIVRLKKELEQYEKMYDKLSGLRKDSCQLSEIKKQGGGFDKCTFMYNEGKFRLWEAKLMNFQQSLKKLTDKFVNRLIST